MISWNRVVKTKAIFYLLMISALLFLSSAALATCHPPADNRRSQYIVAYGSLLEECSKRSTDPGAGPNIPVKILGFQRAWIVKSSDITYLGTTFNKQANFNSAVFRVAFSNLRKYDRREGLYCRVEIFPPQIQNLTQKKWPHNAQFWIYIPKTGNTAPPAEQTPIMQSYVDMFLSGCLNLQDQFNLKDYAKECILTTANWFRDYWINDRLDPRRPPCSSRDMTTQIDQLLAEHLPSDLGK